MNILRLVCLLGVLCALPAASARADDSSKWSGCNMWGCWYNGGGCNQWGCWNTRYGACNQWGCSNNGACTMHGCPPGPPFPTRGPGRARPPIIVQQQVVPAPPQRPIPAPPPPPVDYAQDTGRAPDTIRSFDGVGLRFDYADALKVSAKTGTQGAYVELSGPRSFDAYILRKKSERTPESVRAETTDGLVQDFASRGLRKLGSSVIGADFRDGVRQGVRVRMDNRDDVYLLDSFAWRRADGDVVVVLFTYKSGDADLALRFLPTLTQSLQ